MSALLEEVGTEQENKTNKVNQIDSESNKYNIAA
jgi:hypothetical protein